MSCYSKLLKNCNEYKDVLRYIENGIAPSGIIGLPSSPKAHLIHSLCEDTSRGAVVILPDEASARKFTSDINEFTGKGKKAYFFPARDYSFNTSQSQSSLLCRKCTSAYNPSRGIEKPFFPYRLLNGGFV